ncbi:MAG: response regulator transcription factor [Ktedonobacteraceae bacterium]|nr:response regulator transcription factor [Ktedonobacteraceae bacterium]
MKKEQESVTEQITIAIADDHALVRQGIRTFLAVSPEFSIVGEAGSGEEIVRIVDEQVPDVVLMDLAMGGMDGVEATRQIRRISPHTQIIALTSFDDDGSIFPALRAGALSYLLKETSVETLSETIRKAARGESVLHPRVAARVVQEMQGARSSAPHLFAELSARELEVLQLIARGLSNAEIAARLVISEKTVKVHVSNILSKLHLLDRTQAAVFAWQQGLIRRDQQKEG